MQPTSVDSQPQPPKKLYWDRNFQIICAVSLMAVLGVSSVTPAFPKIAIAFDVYPEKLGLLVTVFTFPAVILGPIIGVFADKWGRKKIIVPSLFLFAIAGTACVFVRDFNLLLLFRFLQGIGAASLLSLSITLIGDLYTGDKRTTAMGYNASVTSVGTASYPTIGGALATLGWYYPFLLPLIAVPVGLLVLFVLKNPEPQGERNLKEYLKNALPVLKNRKLAGLFIGSAANFVLLYGAYISYLPELISHKFRAPAFTIGLLLSSISVAITLTSLQLGRLTRKFHTTTLIRASFILYALALLIVPLIQNIWLLLIPATIFGMGLGIGSPSIQTRLTEIAPKQYLATILSVNGTFFGLGQTLGPLLMLVAFSLGGINSVFYAGAVFAVLTLVVFRYCTCL